MKKQIFCMMLLFCLTLNITLSCLHFQSGCEDVRESVLRLHVIANSDSREDQQLKLKVRDAILEQGSSLLYGCRSLQQSKQVVKENQHTLTQIAVCAVQNNGYDYPVTCRLEQDYFPTRTYGSYTLPAGTYQAVRIVIGEGKGHNWWCVMFPPLCLPAAGEHIALSDVLNQDGMDVVLSDRRYEIRFKITEWIEKWKSRHQ